MIKPTVGRVVWYTPSPGDIMVCRDQPLKADIVYVWNDRLVNLFIVDADGNPHQRTSVPLLQEGDERPQAFFCEWMPYQKGQAAKSEALEKEIAAVKGPAKPSPEVTCERPNDCQFPACACGKIDEPGKGFPGGVVPEPPATLGEVFLPTETTVAQLTAVERKGDDHLNRQL